MDKLSYRRHRFPSIVIQQAVWLYFRFALSYRDVEDAFSQSTPPSTMCSTSNAI
jgi:putative transposase